jgi:hypothetical protein
MIPGKPLDKTIVATVDEFFLDKEERPTREELFAGLPESPEHPEHQPKSHKDRSLKHIATLLTDSGVSAYPYYSNVLLLAYRGDYFEDKFPLRDTEFGPRLRSWRSLRNILKGKDTVIAFDRNALETGASMLLEVICGMRKFETYLIPKNEPPLYHLGNKQEINKVLPELDALGELLRNSLPPEPPKTPDGMPTLPTDAKVYVCWYSQLREVIARAANEEKDFPSKLKVCALPNGGVTGDWYIGVLNGSVSVSLGQQLMEILCRRREEYKRLNQGVGLPTTADFYSQKDIMAWPGSTVYLSELEPILRNANSRAKFKYYQRIRTVLYEAWKELLNSNEAGAILDSLPSRLKPCVD